MSVYFLPALLALLFKLFVMAFVLKGGRVSKLFLTLVVVFAIHNAIEVMGYFDVQNGNAVTVFFRLYYVATVYVLLYILLHGLSVSKLENNALTAVLISAATGLSFLMLFSNLIVAGQYSIGYTMTANKGPLYWLFALFLFATLIGNFIALFIGYSRAKSQIDSVRCVHSFFALTPVVLTFMAAIVFKMADININATGLVPIATAMFLAIMLKTESKHKLSDLRRVMPLSPERQTTQAMMDLLDEYIQNGHKENVYKDLQAGIEREIIKYSLNHCEGNVSETAKMMGLKNRSTLYSMVNRLDVSLNELKHESAKIRG
ncbi:MAG: hypothetical protein KTR16_03880 [Acidiferrobacterales bacterium]|nr:hypothetical protein [Acidiferrobacterales bacterium]